MSQDENAKVLAEAQRRLEALERRLKVEEALDRVRARALAMRRSDELASVAAVMLREEKALGIKSMRSGIGIVTADETQADVWSVSITADGKDDLALTFHFPLEGHPALDGHQLLAADLHGQLLQRRQAQCAHRAQACGLADLPERDGLLATVAGEEPPATSPAAKWWPSS